MKDIDAGTYKCIATNKLGNDTASRSLTVGKIKGAVESLPEFFWRIVMKLPEFNLFCDKSARIFLIFLSICPNFNGFSKFGGGGQLLFFCGKIYHCRHNSFFQKWRVGWTLQQI